MDASWHERLDHLFERALGLPPEARTAFLAEACGSDTALRDELTSLLAAHDASSDFFEDLADWVVTPALTAVGAADRERSAAATDEEFAPGETVAHYEILGRVGSGGMGVVYKARDRRLDRLVALKFLPPGLTTASPAGDRLVAEAKAASALDHPNIGVVYEIAEAEPGRAFIAMAWYEGETLKERLACGPLPVPEALAIATQLADALAAAHRAGIVHRDVKPANVLITGQGVAKLVDFGIAKVTGVELTKEGTTLGTVAYMSPEQTRGQVVDQRADLWSLGVVLHEMLAGERPFRAEDEQALIYAIRHDAPEPIAEVRPEVPGALADIVGVCLEKDPARRYGGAEELLEELSRLEVEGGRPDRSARRWNLPFPGRRSSRRPAWLGGASLLLVGAIAAGAWLGLRGTEGAGEPLTDGPSNGGSHVSASSVAVLPFMVRGSADFDYLREGMVSLLATKLYGAGELRSVDPHALLRRAGEQDAWDPARAAALAVDMGAGLYILGNVVGSGAHLHLNASLYDTGAHTPVAHAEVEGSAEELFALVDRLAVELLATRLRQPEAGLGRAADLTTHSLPALRAFLHGEMNRRVYDYAPAREAYRQAVREDSTFALAHLRLVSLSWGPGRHLMRPSVDAALRDRQRLSRRDRDFLEAQAAFLHSPLDVERMIRDLTVRYPEDGEAWSLLGELLWHANAWRGRSRTEAREPLERALALDPTFTEPFIHLFGIAIAEGRHEELGALVARYVSATGRENHPLQWWTRYVSGSEAERRRALAELRSAEGDVWRQVLDVAVGAGPPELLEALLDLQRERPMSPPPAFGWRMALAYGRPQEAVAYLKQAVVDLSSAQPIDDELRLVLESRIALLPLRDPPIGELARLRAELLALPPGTSFQRRDQGATDLAQQRLSLLGVLSFLLNDLETAERYSRELERLEGTHAYGVAARVRSRALRALLARERGHPAEALQLLESVEPEMFSLCDWCTGSSTRVDFSFERFLRAELLRDRGREREALFHYPSAVANPYGWYGSVAHLRLAEIHDGLGDREKAIHHYTFFTLLWRDAEPELRPLVERAARRLAALREG